MSNDIKSALNQCSRSSRLQVLHGYLKTAYNFVGNNITVNLKSITL